MNIFPGLAAGDRFLNASKRFRVLVAGRRFGKYLSGDGWAPIQAAWGPRPPCVVCRSNE